VPTVRPVSQTRGQKFSRDLRFSEKKCEDVLKLLGIKALNSAQTALLPDIFAGRDLLAMSPTGSGKSVLYQLPALKENDDASVARRSACLLTVVFSPLVALIEDQTSKAKARFNTACGVASIEGGLSQEAVEDLLARLVKGKVGLLYLTPEYWANSARVADALSGLFRRRLLSRFVLDEAHCLPTQYQDLRSDFGLLRRIRTLFPNVPWLCTSATLTQEDCRVLTEVLQLKQPRIYRESLCRPNLAIQVFQRWPDPHQQVLQLIIDNHRKSRGIVFVSTRAEAESLQALLAKSGISAVFYHAGLEPGERARWQREVTLGLIDVVIGTNALAMGLDVKDFRFCIHAGMTASPHEYAQEIGRAGRDGASASAYYLYDYADKHLRFDLICKPPALNEFTDAKARAQSAERDESVVVQQQDLVLASVQLLENQDSAGLTSRGELAERHAINRDQGVEQSHCTKATGALSLHQTRPNVVRATQTNRRLRFAP